MLVITNCQILHNAYIYICVCVCVFVCVCMFITIDNYKQVFNTDYLLLIKIIIYAYLCVLSVDYFYIHRVL